MSTNPLYTYYIYLIYAYNYLILVQYSKRKYK